MPAIKHIAVIRLSAMGDVAMTVPVLTALVQQHPGIKITMISRPLFKPFFDSIPNVDFVAFDSKARHKGFTGVIKFYFEIRKLKIDAFADLHNVLRSKVMSTLFRLAGRPTATVDKARAEKKALTRAENKVFKPLTPIPHRYAKVFADLGFQIDLSTVDLPAIKPLTDDVLSLSGQKMEQKWIGIAPFAQHEPKVYPHDLMQQVIDSLAQNPHYKIFLFGGGETESRLLREFAKNRQNVIVVAGMLSFASELNLISNLDVMLSMDSGNAHMAAMFGINVVTLWGATHPHAGFAPFGQPAENALTPDRRQFPLLPTSIYGNKTVPGYEDVMRTISPETVVRRVVFLVKEEG